MTATNQATVLAPHTQQPTHKLLHTQKDLQSCTEAHEPFITYVHPVQALPVTLVPAQGACQSCLPLRLERALAATGCGAASPTLPLERGRPPGGLRTTLAGSLSQCCTGMTKG